MQKIKKNKVKAVKGKGKTQPPNSNGSQGTGSNSKYAPSKRASLPQVLESKARGKSKAVLTLEEAMDIKIMIGVKPDEKKKVEGSGLLKRLEDCKVDLEKFQIMNDLEGVRHNRLVFVSSEVEGRKSMSKEMLVLELVAKGVDLDLVKECIAAATEVGDPYVKRDLVLLKE